MRRLSNAVLLLTLSAALASAAACGRAESRPARASHPAAPPAARDAGESATAAADEDGDGLPDAAELRSHGDRESLRRWLTGLAEAQFYEVSEEWNREQRDCAGLVRFALREALRPHDRAWFQRMGANYEPLAPDVRAYALGRGPLGEKLFRTAPGSFKQSDLADGTLSEFADARTLKDYNAEFVSRDPARAEPGDLLFFHQPWVQKYPYHVMIFLGRARVDGAGAADWVVYHTGASPASAGEVRKARLSVLARHPDPRWRPVAGNRNFLGFYRLSILQ